MDITTLNIDFLQPGTMSIDLVGAAIESPRSLSGITGAVDFSGGGFWQVKYGKINLLSPGQHLVWQRLRNYLRGGVRSVVVPFLTDYAVPGSADPVLSTFSDSSVFSDGSQFSQDAVAGVVVGATALNATTITIIVLGGNPLQGGETFSINHPTKGFRAYGISEIDGASAPDPTTGAITYTVGIAPAIREATLDRTKIDLVRPRCLMRLQAGTSMSWDVEPYWRSAPDLTLIESFV